MTHEISIPMQSSGIPDTASGKSIKREDHGFGEDAFALSILGLIS
ncbi:hypothetical protein [Noviherbaspirillum massiliense]|nr:hypothetical protein [Noviherbaspirillum massiliense]